MRFYSKARRLPTINIVSLIDILCILLIFFIVTTRFKEVLPEIEIQLPEATSATKEKNDNEPVIIYATKKKEVFVGDTKVPLENLASVLKERMLVMKKPVFALKTDTDLDVGTFVKIMEASKEAGIDDLSMYTNDPK